MRGLIAAAAALVTAAPHVVSAQSTARSTPDCARLGADVEAANARLLGSSDAVSARFRSSLQKQATARQNADRSRTAMATRGLATGMLGMVLPGADIIGSVVGGASGTPKAPDGGDASEAELNATLSDLSSQNTMAIRLADAFEKYQASGCRAGQETK